MIDSKTVNLRSDKGIYRDFEAYTKMINVKGNKRSVRAFIKKVK